ncbi:hypothetical protein AAW01_13115 [Aurantiacibacter gangjinensis]|uniref:Uncharacterized protein n=1 Tax=Aurantiacibacter gangjinensis TaxID=502682 RepID=A0A0G9MPJ6_9SPHN|nr:hypothetical protein AAW01_13115 [Aurantiacibacter gangjinensis]
MSAGAALAAAAAFSPLALQAQSAPYFTAELAAPTDEEEVIAGGVLFRCEGTTCTGPRSRDRDLRVCSELRREVGSIVRFTVRGEDMRDSHLNRCNG